MGTNPIWDSDFFPSSPYMKYHVAVVPSLIYSAKLHYNTPLDKSGRKIRSESRKKSKAKRVN